MDTGKMEEVLQKIAEAHGVSVEEVRREIELAAKFAQENPDPKIQAHWASIPRRGDALTPNELIAHLATMVEDRMK
ncbi:MAG: hypothetical protein FWE12_05485 [Oscillospiraceae bacterium]|nr:hypothetical protein [Oscillospiraceae bacterium]